MIDNLDISQRLDFVAKGNTIFYRIMEFYNDDDTPINITDYTFKLQVKTAPKGTLLIEFSEEEGNLTKFDDYIVLEQLIEIEAGKYYYDMLVTKTGEQDYYLDGEFTVLTHITEDTI